MSAKGATTAAPKAAAPTRIKARKESAEKSVTCRVLPPGVLTARRIERSILYAEYGYYVFFIVMFPTLLWRYGETLRYDMGFGSGDPICDELTQWILEGGGSIDGSRCVFTPEGGGRGIVASSRLAYRQTYSVVPLTMCMYEQTVKEHSLIATPVLINDPVVQKTAGHPWGPNSTGDPWRLILAMDYERQRGEESFWSAYINSMPTKPTSPLWWNNSQFDELHSPRVKHEAIKLRDSVKEAYNTFYPHLTEAHPELYAGMNMTFDSFLWATLQVWGRAFDASAQDPDHPDRRTWMMVPFIDLVNHQSFVGSYYGDEEATIEGPNGTEAAFSCWATECFTPGAEIFQSYGSHKSSAHYLYYYGFIPMGFEQSDFITFKLPPALENRLAKNSWQMGYAGADGRITEGFLHQFVRAIVIQEKHDLEEISFDPTKKQVVVLTAEVDANEAAWRVVLEFLLDNVENALAMLPTSLDEDEAALEAALEALDFQYDRWVQLTVRVRFKRILNSVRSNLKFRLASDVNSEDSWETAQQEWSIVYETDTVNQRRSKALQSETLYEIQLNPDIEAMASRIA